MPHPDKPQNTTEILLEHTYKGCIHWFEFSSNIKAKTIDDIHPCVIIGKNNRISKRVIISPVTDAENYLDENGKLKYPYHVLLRKNDFTFLDKDSVILLDQVFTIPKEDLFEEWFMGKVEAVREIDEAIMRNYDLLSTVSELLHEMIDNLTQTQQLEVG